MHTLNRIGPSSYACRVHTQHARPHTHRQFTLQNGLFSPYLVQCCYSCNNSPLLCELSDQLSVTSKLLRASIAEREAMSSPSPSPTPPLSPNSHESLLNRKPELRTVCAVVRTARWHQLGIKLGVDTQMLDDIKIEKSETQEKRTQMFRLWLASQPEASHRQLVEALKLKVIGEDAMAVEYEEKVKQQTLEIIAASQEDSTRGLGKFYTA